VGLGLEVVGLVVQGALWRSWILRVFLVCLGEMYKAVVALYAVRRAL